MDPFTGYASLLIISAVYFLPSLTAASRHHHNATAIFVLNLLAGWSGIGWLIAICWAFTEVHQTPKVVPEAYLG